MDNKDLLKQYVDTGLKLPKYQVKKLPNSLLRTYLRKRLIGLSNAELTEGGDEELYIDDYYEIEPYEFSLFNTENLKSYISIILNLGVKPIYDGLYNSSDEIREFYLDKIIEKNKFVDTDVYKQLSDESKKKYIDYLLTSNKYLFATQIGQTPEALRHYYLSNRLKSDIPIQNWEFKYLNDEQKVDSVIQKYRLNSYMSFDEILYAPEEIQKEYLTKKLTFVLSDNQLEKLTDNVFLAYVKHRINTGVNIRDYEKERYEQLQHR